MKILQMLISWAQTIYAGILNLGTLVFGKLAIIPITIGRLIGRMIGEGTATQAEILYQWFAKLASLLQSPLLLIMRLYWGWQFFQTGWGKLTHLSRTAEFFDSLHIPLPWLNALMAGSTECFGGLLLFMGLAARLAAIPLSITMIVALLTADNEAVMKIFTDPDKFFATDPFLFLLTSVIVLAFGPGVFSLDWVIGWGIRNRTASKASL